MSQISGLLVKLNEHLIQINRIVEEMNRICNEDLNSKPNDELANPRKQSSNFPSKSVTSSFRNQLNQLNDEMNDLNVEKDYNKNIKPSYEKIHKESMNKNQGPKRLKINFKNKEGEITALNLDPEISVNEMLEIYLGRLYGPDQLEEGKKQYVFAYKTQQLNYDDDKSINYIFKEKNPMVNVISSSKILK